MGKGEFGAQGGADAGWAVEPEAPAEGFHPVFETDQPGSTGRVGAAATVVAHRDSQHTIAGVGVVGGDLDVHGAGVGVFGDVGQRFGQQVVGGALDVFGQPLGDGNIEIHRDR